MKQFSMPVQRTAHYYMLGEPSPEEQELWLTCHGYGQNAEDFLKDFQPLASAQRLIVAPEGLSRFYWGGFHGPIAASWMTSKDRLSEIEDYCNWLDSLYAKLLEQLPKTVRITLFGFSQGTATVMRWIHARQPKHDRLILWAGMTPEDIDYSHLLNKWPKDNCWMAYGNQDKFVTKERMNWQKSFAEEQGIPLNYHEFDGKHKILPEPLLAIANGTT